ncbi:transmembrane protein, putative (macronuclear) [Tetrahymena thermophila SB210]|uniref:Transmembrane protein, putative n=1 Tax=Tetrahymena thermophila (strain SB210) TaxID=312017 RepID=Q22L25_TETTS|nr:transmembrane protein, putative [Tetrahymena thermophila SB210]EAR85992.2 transmembrane protein, putative [Tetrahymena thermophila SB210]|eukprot:XP_976587.2 transmembrane protein, putative [Tetrahymena thermophila SB210]
MKVLQNFQNIDLFGTQIGIQYNKRHSFNTKLGGFITFGLSAILILYIANIVQVYFSHSQVSVIQEIQNIPNSKQFNLSANNFSFMVGVTDVYYNQFIDDSVYTLTVKQNIQQKLLNQTTGKYYTQQKTNNLKLQRCTENHFQIQSTQDFFLQQDYTNFFCLSLDEQLQLQGIYNSEIFKQIEIEVRSCSGNNCADPTYISKKLNNCYFQVYFINKNVKTTDLNNPFDPIGRSVFYIAGTGFSKTINLYFAQNIISTDTGIVMEDTQEQTDLTFSSDREQVVSQNGNRLFLLQMSLDPNKQIKYTRKYLTISQGLSQIGGIYNILFAIGCFICMPYAQLQYKRNLMNKVFGFEYSDFEQQKQQNKEEGENNKNNKDVLETLEQRGIYTNYEKDSIQVGIKDKVQQLTDLEEQHTNQNEQKTMQNSARNRQKSLNFTEKYARLSINQKQKENDKDLKRFFKQTFEQLRIKSCDYFGYYLSFFTCRRQKRSEVIDYGLQKLYNHLDIVYILNKLIEFEKLKKLLLNENQLRLFDYIPKPIIKVNKNTNQIIQTDQNDSSNAGIFYEDKRTLIQKAEDAQEAYNNIINQSQQNTELNQKLINLLHPKLIELFKLQSFDRSDFLKDKSPYSRFKKSQFMITSYDTDRNFFHSTQRCKNEYSQVLNTLQPGRAQIKDIQTITPCQQDTNDLNGDNEYEIYQIPVIDTYSKYLRNQEKMIQNKRTLNLNENQ